VSHKVASLAECALVRVTSAATVTTMPQIAHVDTAVGDAPARGGADELTVADLSGTGVQDTAIAVRAARRARDGGDGTIVRAQVPIRVARSAWPDPRGRTAWRAFNTLTPRSILMASGRTRLWR